MGLGTIKRREDRAGPDFKAKRPSVNGIVSVCFCIAAIVLFVIAGAMSSRAQGNGDERVGILGIVSAFSCLLGTTLGISGFREREVNYLFAYIGTATNLLMLIWLLYLFLYGLF